MASAVRDNILAVFDSLSPKQRRLARFILDSEEVVAFASADELAAQVGTSAATVVRFARPLATTATPTFSRPCAPTFRSSAPLPRRWLSALPAATPFLSGCAKWSPSSALATFARRSNRSTCRVEQIVSALCRAAHLHLRRWPFCRFRAAGSMPSPCSASRRAFTEAGLSARCWRSRRCRRMMW